MSDTWKLLSDLGLGLVCSLSRLRIVSLTIDINLLVDQNCSFLCITGKCYLIYKIAAVIHLFSERQFGIQLPWEPSE